MTAGKLSADEDHVMNWKAPGQLLSGPCAEIVFVNSYFCILNCLFDIRTLKYEI